MDNLSKIELALIEKHGKYNSCISIERIVSKWYDNNENLCVRYTNDYWYHYNTQNKEWR